MVVTKVYAWLLILGGLFIAITMPSIREASHTPEGMSNSIAAVGLIILGIGLFLLLKT